MFAIRFKCIVFLVWAFFSGCATGRNYGDLFEALIYRDASRFRHVLDRGDNPNVRIAFQPGKIIYGPVGECAPGSSLLYVAATIDDERFIKALISHGAALDITNEYDGSSPIFGAIEARNSKNLRCLVEAGANVNLRQTKNTKSSPLEWAIVHGNYQAAVILVKNGADWKSATMGTRSILDVAKRQKGKIFYREEEKWCEQLIALIEGDTGAGHFEDQSPQAFGKR